MQNLDTMSKFGWLPAFEGEETLFSWAAKTNLTRGVSARRTSSELFGNLRAARMHSALSGLHHLCRVTDGLLGTPAELVSTRTSLAGYLPFMPPSEREALVHAFADGDCGVGDLLLGHRASKLPGAQFLRYCLTCAVSDKKRLGYCRWLLVHQLPAVWVCPVHNEELIELPGTATVWQLPSDTEAPNAYRVPDGFLDVLSRFASISCAAYRLGDVHPACLRDAAIERACSIGLVPNPRRLSAEDVFNAFRQSRVGAWTARYEPLKLLATRDDWIVSLLRGRTADNPVKWAIVWAFLWENASKAQSLEAFRQAATGQPAPDDPSQLELWPRSGLAMKLCIERVERALAQFQTLTQAARALGITYKVLSRWISESPGLRENWLARSRRRRSPTSID